MPYECSGRQNVYLKISNIDETLHKLSFFIERPGNAYYIATLMYCRIKTEDLIFFKNYSDKFNNPIKVNKSDSKGLDIINVAAVGMQFWLGKKQSKFKSSIVDSHFKVIESYEDRDFGFTLKDWSDEVVLAHLYYPQYLEFFYHTDNGLLFFEDASIAHATAFADIQVSLDSQEWNSMDAPQSYEKLILKLIRAEALKKVGVRHPGFVIEFPFIYTAFYTGEPICFMHNKEIFYGEVVSVNSTADAPNNSSTTSVIIGGVSSLKDALILSGVTLEDLTTYTGQTLGLSILNPLIQNISDPSLTLDWRMGVTVDLHKMLLEVGYTEEALKDYPDTVPLYLLVCKKNYIKNGINYQNKELLQSIFKSLGLSGDIPGVWLILTDGRLELYSKAWKEYLKVFKKEKVAKLETYLKTSSLSYYFMIIDLIYRRFKAKGSALEADQKNFLYWFNTVIPGASGVAPASLAYYENFLLPRHIFSNSLVREGLGASLLEKSRGEELGGNERYLDYLDAEKLKDSTSVIKEAGQLVSFIKDTRQKVRPYSPETLGKIKIADTKIID